MYYVLRLMSSVLCLMSDALCLMSYVLRLMSYVLCFVSNFFICAFFSRFLIPRRIFRQLGPAFLVVYIYMLLINTYILHCTYVCKYIYGFLLYYIYYISLYKFYNIYIYKDINIL